MASSSSNSSASATLQQWALPRLQQLLPLDEESLRQVVQYASTLSKEQAADHLKNLLGDDGKALEFIASFNLRRQNAPGAQAQSQPQSQQAASTAAASAPSSRGGAGGAARGRGGKKRANIHSLPARQLQGQGDVAGAYVKKSQDEDEDFYNPAQRQHHKTVVADNLVLRETKHPDATQMPLITDDASLTSKGITSKAPPASSARAPPSAAGPLVSDSLAPRQRGGASSATSSRTQSPTSSQQQHKMKVALSGGAQMRGASSALSDLDSAIRSLEMQTNPSLSSSSSSSEEDQARRQCNCMATRHPLLDIAPNCQNCGKIICLKQGLGPCTFCSTPLLSSDEINKVLRVLKDERGEEKTRLNNASHRRADVSQGKPRAFTGRDFLAAQHSQQQQQSPLSSHPATPTLSSDDDAPSSSSNPTARLDPTQAAAQAHRDKLLNFQSQNARRTQIHDEAADFDLLSSGTNLWASPAERAQQLKRQQRALRELEWSSRPEWEKRKVVASIDLKGGRVVRRMAEAERPDFGADDHEEEGGSAGAAEDRGSLRDGDSARGGGAFSRNPLAKGLVRPVARESAAADKGKAKEDAGRVERKKNLWRRVQMDEDDNEQWILDGGVYGGQDVDVPLGAEEHGDGS